jgi:hypothetical protein
MRLFLTIILIFTAVLVSGQEFSRTTKHKPIKRMSRSDVRKAQIGVDLYERVGAIVYRNSGRAWTKARMPKDNANRKQRSPEQIRKESIKYQKTWQNSENLKPNMN